LRPAERIGCAEEDTGMALVIGLVSIAVIWLVVIYGSLYVNKNVQ
jgi:hypothetical protein